MCFRSEKFAAMVGLIAECCIEIAETSAEEVGKENAWNEWSLGEVYFC